MKVRIITAAAMMLCGSLAFAQTCPTGSVVLVPSRTTSTLQATTSYPVCPPASMTSATVVPYTSMTASMPMASYCPIGTTSAMYPSYYSSIPSMSCGNVSQDTACLLNSIAGLRDDVRSVQGTVRAASIEMRGQALISRINALMSDEMMFRQRLSANPNLPDAQATAMMLSNEANALNRDLQAYNQELSLVPVDQRPYVANQLNSFTVAYWNPTMQQFTTYRTQFAQVTPSYQVAYAANPWLQNWQSSFQTSLNNISIPSQTYALACLPSSNLTTQVLGSTEIYPSGTPMVLPQGAVIYIPAGSAVMMGNVGTAMCPIPAQPVATLPMVCPPTTTVLGTVETIPPVTTPPVMAPPPVTTPPVITPPVTPPRPPAGQRW